MFGFLQVLLKGIEPKFRDEEKQVETGRNLQLVADAACDAEEAIVGD